MKVHQIKIDFNVTETISRYVFIYLIESEYIYMIDSGVYGSETIIIDYLSRIGRDINDIKAIFLTHAHPDHIGMAAWFRKHTECKVYASLKEKLWIEDIDLQFKERPIPNFYNLAGKSCSIDHVIKNGDIIQLEKELCLEVVETPGHSCDGLSFVVDDVMFIGDALPVKGDIPIFINEKKTRETIELLEKKEDINVFYPAWDTTYSKELMKEKIKDAKELIDILKNTVIQLDKQQTLPVLVNEVCEFLQMPMLKMNPLFAKTVSCLREVKV